ncbi:MAG: methionine--tRNA ligase [Bacteroidetes bacterium]|nr:methionine--tRNA ligase [Bacteroidota bacterium]MBV6461380.1 Methionine--tRNA ligase [Flavobacteriales bacterium]WKZ75219.1 MAG: methionine--tRNA ligase [Vicingaceae bacterium]MCL4816486.1 methionine--tRNA ligase [Flavobacteriales bacterium]NOG94418.1 methionine--tRNA ligase [Bacteroidota bacterium]
MKTPERYLITAALPYANGPLHIGHIAGCYLPADTYVRYLRLHGKDVKFICGSDEHGVPITIKAKKENTTPQQVVNTYHEIMKNAFTDFGISFDIYSRTSNSTHHQTAADFFKTLYDKKVFSEEFTEQYFDEKANQFLADRYITGTCPKCGNPSAYGDQCEKCGVSLNPTDLINPTSVLSGEKPILKKTKNWFLPLNQLQAPIEKYIDSHKADWKSNVYGQCKSWLNQGLQPRAMTRDLDWGVRVPLQDAEGKVLYVWFDAPIGYISATKELLPDTWEQYWKNENTHLIHFIGKDNIVFHCIIFPAMLMAHGQYVLPENIPANEFLNLEGDKISTSRNWAVWLHEYLNEFPNKQDELRYVLTSIAPETSDSEFTWKDYQNRVNNELVAILGNFINRIAVLMQKYFDGTIPGNGEISIHNNSVETVIKNTYDALAKNIENYKFRQGLFEVMELARFGNKFLTDAEPWKTMHTDTEKATQVLTDCLHIIAHLGVCLQPFLPFTSKKIFEQLNLKEKYCWKDHISIYAGNRMNKPDLLFQKIEDEAIQFQINKLHKPIPETSANIQAQKESISYDDFTKMDIRVGEILAAEKVEKADKLLKLTIDTGIDKRTVVSGIAEYYTPEKIIGKKVSVLVNLAPRKIKGIESCGMILMAENSEGKLVFVQPEKNDFENGSIIR